MVYESGRAIFVRSDWDSGSILQSSRLSPSLSAVRWLVNVPFRSFCPRVDLTISLMLSTSAVVKTDFRMLAGTTIFIYLWFYIVNFTLWAPYGHNIAFLKQIMVTIQNVLRSKCFTSFILLEEGLQNNMTHFVFVRWISWGHSSTTHSESEEWSICLTVKVSKTLLNIKQC